MILERNPIKDYQIFLKIHICDAFCEKGPEVAQNEIEFIAYCFRGPYDEQFKKEMSEIGWGFSE